MQHIYTKQLKFLPFLSLKKVETAEKMDKTLSVTVAFCSVWLLGYWIGYYSQNCVTVYGSVVIKHDSPVDGRSLPHDKPKHVNLFFGMYIKGHPSD